MRIFKTITNIGKYSAIIVATNLLIFAASGPAYTQPAKFPEHPPRPAKVEVSVLNYLNFGSFYHYGTGGTVTISPTGSRSVSGDVVQFTGSFSAGLVTVSGHKGTVVSFIIPSSFIYSGANSIRLDDLTTDPLSVVLPNIDSPATADVSIGGTLYIGESSNPPGVYAGTFIITVVQE